MVKEAQVSQFADNGDPGSLFSWKSPKFYDTGSNYTGHRSLTALHRHERVIPQQVQAVTELLWYCSHAKRTANM